MITHEFRRYATGKLAGIVACSWTEGLELVEFVSLATGRRLPEPKNSEQLGRRAARCRGCGQDLSIIDPIESTTPQGAP